MGGAQGSNLSTWLKTCEVYNPVDNSWNMIADISSIPIDCQSTAVIGGKIFQIGGYTGSPDITAGITSVSAYDPMDNSWNSTYPPMPSPRFCGCATTMGGKIYYMGGRYNGANHSNMYIYDPSLVPMPQITYQGEDFYVSAQRGGPKTFVIPHPEHKGKMLRHACVEAPTRGTNIYEYQIVVKKNNATTKIELPSYFKHINDRPRVYVYAENVFFYLLWHRK